jgi:hypothetical protein
MLRPRSVIGVSGYIPSRTQRPARSQASARGNSRTVLISSPIAVSATSSVRTSGVLVTTTLRMAASAAAVMS